MRGRKNSTQIGGGCETARNSGREFLSAMAVTYSEGRIPGRTVRIREPKDFQT